MAKNYDQMVSVEKMPRTVYDLVTRSMETLFPECVAFRAVAEDGQTVLEWTYAQMAEDIRRTVTYLKESIPDIKGKKVAILSRNCYEYGVLSFGTMLSGAVLVTLNYKKTWPELEYELGLVEPALIFEDGIDYGCRAELEQAYGSLLRPMNAYRNSQPGELTNCIDPDELLMLMFTSGTTGRSKAVMQTERNYVTANEMYISGQQTLPLYRKKFAPADRMGKPISHFTLVPFFHLSGFICLWVYSMQGFTLNICSDPRNFYREIKLMPSDTMSTPPVLVEMVYNEIRRGHKDRLNGLWNLSCSSAILDPEILSYLIAHGFYINQCYSMTELAGYGLLNIVQEGEHLRALGKPDGFCEIKLDETGEICVRGDAVMLGYYKDPEATAEAIDKDGWLHSGDLAREDEEGFYYITGRKKNLIILDSGENVSPEELEKLLGKCADIKECVVKEMGKKIGAVICCEPDKEQTVRAFVTELNRTLPLYKRISAVECTAEPLPRNAMGKLLRK
mgnify:CR=1 FL=1